MNKNSSILERKFGSVGKTGNSGEELVWSKLIVAKQKGIYDQIFDYRLDMDMQARGIDFGIKKDSWKRIYYIDSKCSIWRKGNEMGGYLELEKRMYGTLIPGWYCSSQSDRIWMPDLKTNSIYHYDLKDMRRMVTYINYGTDRPKLDMINTNDGVLLSYSFNNPNIKHLIKRIY